MASTRYYPGQERPVRSRRIRGVGLASPFATARARLSSLNQSVSYQPFTFTSLFPSAVPPLPGQIRRTRRWIWRPAAQAYLSLDSNVGLNHALSRRVTFNAALQFRQQRDRVHAFGRDRSSMLFTRHGRRRTPVRPGQGLGVRIGYGYHATAATPASPTRAAPTTSTPASTTAGRCRFPAAPRCRSRPAPPRSRDGDSTSYQCRRQRATWPTRSAAAGWPRGLQPGVPLRRHAARAGVLRLVRASASADWSAAASSSSPASAASIGTIGSTATTLSDFDTYSGD